MPEQTVSGASIMLNDVTKRYPGSAAAAVDHVNLEISAGDVVVLVGPSGCGKTTTMKMINRLIEPSSGQILINEENVLDINADRLRRHVGYAIQQVGLFPHMTVADNVGQVPRMLGWDKRRVRSRVDEMLELTGLDSAEFGRRYPRQLSGGQQQRVGVARALAADPPVLLMDEPFGAVDPITRGNLQDELMNLQAELKKTIVFVTHDFDEALKLGDRIAVLGERSRIAQYDTPEAILANPADDIVAGFVGAGAALKQLNLMRVRDISLGTVTTAPIDGDVAALRSELSGRDIWVLLLDRRNRPVRWVHTRDLARASGSLSRVGRAVGDVVSQRSTLQDGLDAILTEGGGYAAVTGDHGEYVGTVDLDTLMETIRLLRQEQAGAGIPE